MDPAYTRTDDVALDRPVLVLGMEGWIDAGLGAGAAMAHLLGAGSPGEVATWDADRFLDYRDRRPVVRIRDGVTDAIAWPRIHLLATTDRAGNDLVALVGPEPDMAWRAFVASVVELAVELGVRMVVSIGAFPISVPHTRPVRLAATAATAELAERVGVVRGSIAVPAGIHAAILEGAHDAGLPAVGLWARVPHYAAAMPYPAASAALVEGLATLAGLDLDPSDLLAAAALAGARIDELIASSEEHQEMVRQLESVADAEEAAPQLDPSDLPTGDELAAELERFLRGETGTNP